MGAAVFSILNMRDLHEEPFGGQQCKAGANESGRLPMAQAVTLPGHGCLAGQRCGVHGKTGHCAGNGPGTRQVPCGISLGSTPQVR